MPGYQIIVGTGKSRLVLVLPLSIHTEAFPILKDSSKVRSTKSFKDLILRVLVVSIENMLKINKNYDSSK